MVLNQLNNTAEIIKKGGSTLGNTTVNAIKTLGPVLAQGAENTLNLANKTGNLATTITNKGIIPLAGATANTLIKVGGLVGEGVNYGINVLGKGVELANDALNSNQLEIYKEPKKNITHEDIYNKLISSDVQGLNQIYSITQKLIDFKYKDFKLKSKYSAELHNLFLNLQNNQSETNYQLLAKFLVDVKNTEKRGVFSNFLNKLFNSNYPSTDSIKSMQKDIKKVTNQIEKITEKASSSTNALVRHNYLREIETKKEMLSLLNDNINLLNEESKESSRYPKRNKESNYVNPLYEKNMKNEEKYNPNVQQNYLNTLEYFYGDNFKKQKEDIKNLQMKILNDIKSGNYNNDVEYDKLNNEYNNLDKIFEYKYEDKYIDMKNNIKQRIEDEKMIFKERLKTMHHKSKAYHKFDDQNKINYQKLFNTDLKTSKKELSPNIYTSRERNIADNATKYIKYTKEKLILKIDTFKKNNPNIKFEHLSSKATKQDIWEYMNYYNIQI